MATAGGDRPLTPTERAAVDENAAANLVTLCSRGHKFLPERPEIP